MGRQRGIQFTLSAFDGFSTTFDNFSRKMDQSTAGLRRLGASMAGVGRSSGIAEVSRSFGAVTTAGTALVGKLALAGGAVGYGFKKGFLDVASQFEDFQIVLNTLNRGDLAKSKKEMGWISDFAAKTPYELAEVTEAFVKLRSYGMEPMNGLLQTLGDTSSSMGKPLSQAVEAIADAVTGENERLKEFGIVGKKVGDKIVYNYTNAAGQQAKLMAKAGDRMAIQATLMKVWGEKFGGGMEAKSKGWTGMWSNLMDAWSRMSNKIMEKGAFDYLKDKLKGILDTIDRMSADGSLDALARQWGENITAGLKNAWEVAKGLATAFGVIATALGAAATALGGWDNLAITVVAFMSAQFLVSVVQLAQSFAVLGAAMMATPLGMMTAALGLITVNFMSCGDVLTGLIQTVSLLTVAWGVLSAVFYASPIGWLVAGLGLVVFAIQKIIQHWDRLMNAFKAIVPDWVLNLLGVSQGASGREGATPGAMRDFGKAYQGFGGATNASDVSRGVTGGDVIPQRPNLGAAQLQRSLQESRYTSLERKETKLTVDFANVPRGTSVRQAGAPVDTSVNYDLGLAMAY